MKRHCKPALWVILTILLILPCQLKAQIINTNIAWAKRDLNNDFYPDETQTWYRVRGRITSQNFATNETHMFIQDTNDNVGIRVYSTALTVDDNTYQIGMEMEVWDYVGQINGLRHINPLFGTRVTRTDTNKVDIQPLTGTIADFLASAENYESSYVVISNVYISEAGNPWPGWNESETLTITDSTGELRLYIEEETDLGGQLAPTNAFDVWGIFSQYDPGTPPDDGYEIIPRSYADIIQTDEQQPPQIMVINSNIYSLASGETLTVDLLGQDRNPEDALTLTTNSAPAGSSITDYGNREAQFTWTPDAGFVGTTNIISFEVSDGIATGSVSIQVFVLSDELANIRLNEVFWDPATGLDGDANGDGVRDAIDDEFVEIANYNTNDIDITGWVLRYGTNVSHTFASAVLTGRTALVVFGGGTPTGPFGESMVFVGDSWNGLSSSPGGNTVNLLTDQGLQVFSFDYDPYPSADQSITRNPDYTGDYELHTNVVPWLRFSPGTLANGKHFLGTGATNTAPLIEPIQDNVVGVGSSIQFFFNTLDPETNIVTLSISNAPASSSFIDNGNGTGTLSYTGEVSDAGTTFAVSLYADDGVMSSSYDFDLIVLEAKYSGLIINEFCPDPTPNIDANGDGVSDSSQDEFIEFVNVTTGELDFAGLQIYDSFGFRHRFTTQLVPTGGAIVVVGGGSITGVTYQPVQTASSGALGLNNDGDSVLLYTPQTTLIARIDYADSTSASWTRAPDITGSWTNHLEATALTRYASPGTRIDGSNFLTNQPPTLIAIGNKSVTVSNELVFTISTIEADEDVVTLLASNKPANADFVDNTDGTGDFTWTPDATETGVYSVTFHAYDKDGFDNETITIYVNETTQGSLMISEVADPGDVANSKFVELFNNSGSTIDFAADTWYLSRQANGGSWADIQLVGSVANGDVFVIAYNETSFTTSYGMAADQYSGSVSGNGDDGYFLYKDGGQASGILVDAYGVQDQDGTGTDWEYTDGRAVRNSDITAPNTIWTASEWTIGAADVADMTPGVHGAMTNRPPLLATIGSKIVALNNALNFDVIANDTTDNDTITLWATDIPAGASFPSNSAATSITGTFNWASASPVGVYTTTFWAADNDGTNSEMITISVNPALPPNYWDFEDSWQGWTQYSRTSTADWERNNIGGGAETTTYYMAANGYGADMASDDWLISPAVDLSSYSNPELSYWTWRRYSGPDITVKISTNYSGTGDPLAVGVVWSDLSFTIPVTEQVWEERTNSLTDYAGLADVYLAFQYTSTGTGGTQAEWWQVDQVRIVDAGGGFVDTDLDGIDDNWELLHFTNLTASGVSSNFDGDASSDLEEYIADTDPHDAASVYDNIISNATGFGVFNLLAGPPTTNSRRYDAYSSTDLVNGAWSPYGLNVPGATDGSTVTLTVTNTLDERFYRTGVYVP